jgi:hypothetical protein
MFLYRSERDPPWGKPGQPPIIPHDLQQSKLRIIHDLIFSKTRLIKSYSKTLTGHSSANVLQLFSNTILHQLHTVRLAITRIMKSDA